VTSPDPAPGHGALAALTTGAGPRLVLAHGFTQNAGAWGPVLGALGIGREVVAVDLPGHGGSATVVRDLPGAATLLGEAGGRADYLGYSLGGRVSLHLALARPDLVRRLVLIGATAGIAGDDERARRRRADDALADELESLHASGDTGPALEAFVARWLTGPLFATLAPDRAERRARLHNTLPGLASSLRGCGTGTQEPLWDRLAQLDMPVLVVAGALDVRFSHTGAAMVGAIGPNATLALVPGAGHACHLERPAATARIVDAFLGHGG
jgi:2-succinyl-6-hydroxy-2,4-cyclohexadiene-1-carboxylate synthase